MPDAVRHSSAPYFFDNVTRLAQPGYVPNDQDILRARVKSTGITELQLNIHGTVYRMCDVGGQRSERKKWYVCLRRQLRPQTLTLFTTTRINCFSDVQVLLFVLAISEYNQQLYEDESVSRISEATTLWQSIANSKWFTNASIILFLNKVRPSRL